MVNDMHLGEWSFFNKKGHYFKYNFTYPVSLDFQYELGDAIFDGWAYVVFFSKCAQAYET